MRPATLTATQKLLLALSFPATLLFLYLLFKRDEEEEDDNVSIKTSRLRVPRDSVKVVIGLQGVQISAIQMKTGTRMSFQDDSEINKDKILVISGPAEGVREAESVVRQLLEDHLPVISETIYIPRSAIKTVLGINRENIRNMSRTSKAKIILNRTEARKKEKQFVEVELRGTSISLLSAKKMIMDLVSKESGDAQRSLEEERCQLDDYSMCFVTAVEHPGHFWIQKIPCSQDYSVDPLDLLIKEMNGFYNSHIPDENNSFAVGDMVTSKLPYDGNWYRAEVKDIVDGDLVLYFVDFGDTEIINQGHVRTLSTQFLSVPFQALECSLANVEPLACHWSEADTKEFENLTNVGKWQPLKFKILGQKGDFHKTLLSIALFDEKSAEGWNIADKLVSTGFAHYHALNELNYTQKVFSIEDNKNEILGSFPLLCSKHLKSRNSYEKQGLYEGSCDHLDGYSTTYENDNVMHQKTAFEDYNNLELNFDIASKYSNAKNQVFPSVKLQMMSPTTERMDYELIVQQSESKTTLTSSTNISYTSIEGHIIPATLLTEDQTLSKTMINYYNTYPSIKQLANYSKELRNQETNFGYENFPTIKFLLSLQNKNNSISEKERLRDVEHKDVERSKNSHLKVKNLNFKNEIGILEEADYEVQHSSFVKCEARSLELSAIDVGTTSEKKEEVESIDLETSETAVEEKVIAEHCPEIVSSIGGEKMPLLSKTISEDLVTTATDSGELSEGVVREEKSDANERVSEFDSDGFFAEYNEGLQVLNQLESGTKGAHIEDVDTLVSYIEGDAKTKIQTKIRKADKSRSRSRESRKKGSREEAAVHVEERIPPYSVSKMMMHHVALHPEYADAEITEDADDTGFKVVGKRKRKISFRRECVSENVNRSHSEENASEQKSVETSLDELLHERNDMDLGDAHKESIFVQETVQMSKRESPKHHDYCEPRDVVFHDLKESLSEEKSPIVCEITETLENLNFKSEIGILEEADYEVQHSSFVKCEARSLELSAIDVGTTSEKKEEVESIDLETSETAVEEKVIAEHCPEIVSSIGGEKMPLLSKTISEDLVTTATDSGELSEGVVREEKSDANERVSEFDSDGFFAEYNEGLQVLNQLESGTKGAHIEDVDTLVSYIEGDAKTKIQTKIRKADKSRSRSRESRKKGSREEAAVHVEERIPPYSVSKMMMHHVALHPEYADAEITEDADDTGFKVVGKRKRKISFRRECVSENVNRSHSEENASEQKSVETSLDELLHERNDMDLGDAHKESIFVQETVQMSKRESPKHHDYCEPRDVVFHDLKESLSEEKSPIVCEITETLENLNFKSEIGILEEADYEVQHSSFVKCEARSLELSAIDVGTTSEKKEEVESIDLETSETAVEEKVIAEHCPEIVSSIGGEKMPLLSKTISEDLVTTATDSGELSEGVVREEKSDANERVSEFDSDGFFAEYNEGLQVLNQLESGTKGAHIEDVDTLVSYIEGDAKTKIQTKIRKADKSRSRSRESRKKGSREEAAVHVEERIPPYSVSKMMMHHVALHPEYADAEITEDADDTGFKVVGKRKRKISFRRECVSENVNRSHSEENASEQKSVETSLDELLHERNDMDLGDAHKESIFVQETVQMSKRESPKHHDYCEPRDVVFHDLKESLSEEKSPIVCEITETLENLNFKSEIGILEEADYEVQHSSFVKCEARSLELSAIDVGTTSEKKEEVESIDLETSETAVEEKVIAEHCPEIVSSIGGEKMPLLSKTISEDLVTTATDSGELSEGVVREEKSDANERVSEFDSDGFFAEYNEGLQVLNQLESGTKGAHIEDVDTLVSYIEGDAKTKIQTKIRKADKSRSRSRESRKKGSREEAAVHVEERIPPYSVSKMMMHHVALHPEYADAEITEDADDTGFKVVGKRKRKISFRRECVSENVNRSHSEENASEQKSVETSLDELLHERNDMDLGDAHKESIFVQETVQMSKRESPKHHDYCEPRDVVFHDLKESLSEEKSPIVCEITETLENLNFKSEIGILEEADYEVQHSSFVKCEARSLELSAIDVGTTSEKKEEVESIDLETSETAVEEKVIAEHCPEIVSSIGGEKMPLLSKTISEDLVTTATDSGELSEGVVREEKSDANERVSEFDSDGFFAEYNEGLQVLNQLESGTKGAHIEDVDTLVSYIEGDAKTKIQTKIRKADKSRSRSRESRKKGSREEAAVHVEERIPPYSVSKMMMHHVALHPEYADAEITEDADDTGFKVVGKRKRKISFRRECVSENVNRSHSEENASEQKSVETSLDELLHERNDMDLGDAHKESIFVQETVQMSKRESPKHHDYCEPRDVVFHDLKESLSEEKSPIVCEITETLENLNFKSEIGILEEADYEVQHSSFVKCEARSLELSAIDVGTTSEKKEEVESIDLETSETAVEEKVIAEHCPEIVSSIGGEKMPLLSKTISEDLVTTATDSGELSEGVVREEKSDANERVSEFDSDGFFAEYNEGLQVLNQLESGTKGAHIEDVDTLVSYIEGDAKTKIQTKIRKADKSRSRSRESRKKGSREEAAVHVEERIPPYSVSKMMMHHVALHPEYADAEITEDADDTGFKVVGKRKRKISFRRECVSENVNRSHSEENASEQKSVETSLDELLHERNDMDLGDAHKESIFVQETVQMSKRESPKHHDYCEPRDVVFHDLKESLSEEKSPIVCEITETLENLNFKSEIGILEEADYEVQHSSFVKCEARSLELSAIDVGTTSEKKEEVESIDLETSETAVEEKVIAEHCPEIVSSIGGEKMPLLSKTISEDLVTTATDSGELSEGVVREEKSDANERVSEFDSDGFFAEYNEGLQVLNQLESGTKGAHIEDVDTLVSYIEGDAKTKIQTKIRKADKSRSRSRESRKKGSREEAAVHVEERIPPYSVSKMMMHHVALHPEYADAEITEDADDTGFKVVGKRKRKISFRRECVSENVNRSHSEENASEQKSVETSLDELLHERNDMDLGDAHKESIFVQETVQMSKRESPKHHDYCEPRDVVFHDLKESLSEEKSPIVCEITETLENLNFKSEIGILEEADYEVQHSSFVKCEARSLELSAIDVGTTSEKKEEVESIDLETSETAVEEKVIAEHCPEIVSSIGGEKMPLLSKTISEDLVTTATDSGELSEGVVREEKSDANERVSEFDSDGFFAEYNEGLQVLNQLESGTKGAHIEDVDTLVSYIEGDAKTKIQTKIRKADKSRSRSRESRKKGSREEAAVHVEERIPPYSVSKMMMHHVALHPEYADAEITEDADDTGFKVVGKRKRKISFRRECVSENVNRSHSEENASEQKSVETSLDELLHERNDMDLGDAHKESIFVQETVQMSKRESPKHHDYCEPRDVVFHDLKESLSEEKSPIVCEITETLENLNFKSEIGILEEADYEVQHSSFVKCEARSLELSAIDVGTTSEKKEEVESIDLETSETAVEEKVIAEHCPEIVSSIGGEKMPLLSKTISEDLVTTATDSGELSEGVVREEKSDANERVSEFDSDGFFAEYNEGLQVLNQLESGTKGAHIEDVDTLVSYIEGDAKTKIQTKIRKADKSRSRSRESRKKGSREEAAVHVEERIPPYSVSKMMMHHVALHPEYADAEITEDADDTGFKVVGKRKRKISFRRECVSENVNRSHSEENASEQKSVETSLDELLHERNDMDLGDAHKESIFVQETVQMSKRESPKHHDYCEPRDVVFHDLKESLSEEKSPIVCEITETLENLNFKSEIGILEEADYEVQHSSFVKCEARSLELSAIDVGTTSEKKEEVESIDLETSETAVEEKVIAEHCPEIVSSIGGEKMPLLSKTISEDLVTTATDSGELSEGVVREEKSDANERVSEFDSDGFFAEYNEGLQVLNQLESGTKGAHIEELKLSKHIPHHDCLLDMTPSVENFKLIEMSVKQCLFGDCSSNQPASLVSHCFYSSGQRLNNVARNDLCSFKESRKDISDYIESQDVNSSKNLYDDDLSLLIQLHEAYYQQCPNSSIVENSNIGHSLSDYLFCSAAPCVENRAPFLYSSKASVFLSYDDFSEMNCLQFFGPSCPTVENLKAFVTHAKPSLIISSIDSFFVLQHASCSYLHSGNGQPLEFAAAGISSSLIECLPTSPVNEKSVDENVPVTKSPQKEEIEVLKVEDSFCPEKSYMKDFYSDLSVRGQFGNLEFGCPKGCANCGEGDSVKSRRKRKSNKINSPSHNPSLECIDHDQDEQQTVELQRRYNMKLTHETTFTSCKMSVEPVCEGSTEIPLDSQNFDSLKQISLKVPSSRQKSKKRRSKHATQEASLKPTDIDQKQISSLVFDGMNVDQIFSPLVSESKFSKASAAMTYCPGLECDHELDRSEAYAGKRMKSIKKRKKKAEGIWISSQGPPPSDSGQESSKGHEVPLQNPQKRVKENKIRSALRKLAQEDPVSRNEKLVMVAGESTHRRK